VGPLWTRSQMTILAAREPIQVGNHRLANQVIANKGLWTSALPNAHIPIAAIP